MSKTIHKDGRISYLKSAGNRMVTGDGFVSTDFRPHKFDCDWLVLHRSPRGGDAFLQYWIDNGGRAETSARA